MHTTYYKLWIFFATTALLSACSTPFKQGKKSFDKAAYQTAIGHFEESLKKTNDARTNAFLAESYRKSNRISEAEPFYKAALDANSNDDEVRFYYGYALKSNGKYEEAKKMFERYSKSGQNSDYRRRAKQEVENLAQLDDILERESYFKIDNLKSLNTEGAEYGPVLYQDRLLFSATRKDATYAGTGQKFSGIYAFDFSNKKEFQGSASLFSPALSLSNANEACPTFALDGSFVIFAQSSTGEKGEADEVNLYISRNSEAGWDKPEILPYPVNISKKLYEEAGVAQLRGSRYEAWTSTPSITPDGKRIYFASNRKGGYGGTDIWTGNINAGGRVSGIRNLGSKINTPGDELFPIVSDAGVLYFASNGHPGLGGLDLFEAIRVDGQITIKNMGTPMNSSADDFAMIWESDSTGYFSSNREEGLGDDDIYHFVDQTPDTKIINYFLAIDVVGFDPADSTRGEYPLANAELDFLFGTKKKRGEKLKDFTSDSEGKIAPFPIELHKDFLIIASAGEDYLKEEQEYTTRGKAILQELVADYPDPVIDTVLRVKVVIEKIVIPDDPDEYTYGKELEINFDFNQANIRPDAAVILDEFAIFLKDNPQIKVELSSHTDAVGSNENNLILSQRRADSTVAYLLKKGIRPERLVARGYGEEKLKVDTQKAEEENRRSEFRIIGIIKKNE